jgi:hypothetical protein
MTETKCIKCDAVLEPVGPSDTNFQFENALWLGFFGGYGMFVESRIFVQDPNDMSEMAIRGASYELVICHDCAHEFMDTNPWMKKVFDPAHSHTHTSKYMMNNPEHYGPDYTSRSSDSEPDLPAPWLIVDEDTWNRNDW